MIVPTADTPTVAWHDLPARTSIPVPGVDRLHWVPATAMAANIARTVRRRTALARNLHPQITPAEAAAGVFVQKPPADRPDQSPMVFAACPWTGRWPVFIRGLSSCLPGLADAHVRVVSGACLFGVSSVVFLGPRGQRYRLDELAEHHEVVDIQVDQALSLYELEQSRRAAAYLAELFTVLPASTSVTAVTDVADLQYREALLGNYLRGRVSEPLLRRWWHEVAKRHHRLSSLGQRYVQTAAWAAGRPDVRTLPSPGLAPAIEVLHQTLTHGRLARAGASDAHAALAGDMVMAMRRSPVGREWNALLDQATPPATVRDVALASYRWVLTRPALTPHPLNRPVVTIMLDDVSELRMYLAARDILTAVAPEQTALVGIFPLRRIHSAGNPATRSLFWTGRSRRFRTAHDGVLTSSQLAARATAFPHGPGSTP